jgi:hypothetical protein
LPKIFTRSYVEQVEELSCKLCEACVTVGCWVLGSALSTKSKIILLSWWRGGERIHLWHGPYLYQNLIFFHCKVCWAATVSSLFRTIFVKIHNMYDNNAIPNLKLLCLVWWACVNVDSSLMRNAQSLWENSTVGGGCAWVGQEACELRSTLSSQFCFEVKLLLKVASI